MTPTIGERVAGLTEYEAKAALLNLVEIIGGYVTCTNDRGEDCPAYPMCDCGNPCRHAWLDIVLKEG